MFKKLKFVFILLFLICLSASCAFAADNNQTAINDLDNNTISIDDIPLAPTDIDDTPLAPTNINVTVDESSIDINDTILPDNIWYVDSNVNSSGNGHSESSPFKTLSEAIKNAKNGDTIYIASGTYTGKENLGMYIDKSLNLIGYGDKKPIFDGEGTNSIFLVHAENFNMLGLSFMNAYSAHDSAISLYVSKMCNLINCDFYNNVKRTLMDLGYESYGGALYASVGAINLIGCNFTSNSADDAGAAAINGATNIINCNFAKNTANLNGGAIIVHGKGLTNVTNTIFTNNYGRGIVGAAYLYGDVKIEECTFKDNTAKEFPDYRIEKDAFKRLIIRRG